MKRVFSLLILFVAHFQIFSQSNDIPASYRSKINGIYYGRHHLAQDQFFNTLKEELGFGAGTQMVLQRETGSSSKKHFRYQQFHNGIPVFGNQIILHTDQGVVTKTNGVYTPGISSVTTPILDESTAMNKALLFLKTDLALSTADQITLDQSALVFIDPAYPSESGQVVLAYQMDLNVDNPFKRHRVFIDAANGKRIFDYSLIHENSVVGTGETRYYGTQTIVSDSVSDKKYSLIDKTRGGGIFVYDENIKVFESEKSDWELSFHDQVALDAMYCSARYYDMLRDTFLWLGVDGNNMALHNNIHSNFAGNVNAFWDGSSANFGDGDCTYGPLTTMDVLGHEFMHGIVEFSSGLIYEGESGAINESLADMMGKTLEFLAVQDKFTWNLGEAFALTPEAEAFRIMDDPKSVEMPALYKGEYWIDGNDVHYNSSIGNLWFVMVSDGRSGINEAGTSFDVEKIGIFKAARIAFNANRDYATSSTTYREFSKHTIDAAIDLYGENSPEELAVREAWKATGVDQASTQDIKDLGFGKSYFYDFFCGDSSLIPVSFNITNFGSYTFTPSENASINIQSLYHGNRNINLEDTIEPGESKLFLIDDWIKADSDLSEQLSFNLNYSDDNQDNDFAFYNFSFLNNAPVELGIFVIGSGETNCRTASRDFTLYLQNNSCRPAPAGTNFNINVYDQLGELIRTDDFTLDTDLESFDSRPYEFTFSADETETEEFTFKLSVANDGFITNNTAYIFSSFLSTINQDFKEDFVDFIPGLSELELITSTFFEPTIYNGQSWLSFTGYSADTSFLQRCVSFESIFNDIQNGRLTGCIDFSDSEKNSMAFDLMTFISTYSETTDYPHSVMAKVSWLGNESGEQYFYGFEDGKLSHVALDLPDFFEGKVLIDFFAELGNFVVDEISYSNDDVLLLTNLEFNKGSLRKKTINETSRLEIFPNPTTGLFRVENTSNLIFKRYQVNDNMGRVVHQGILNGTEIDINHLAPGQYFIQLFDQNGERAAGVVAKQ